MNQQNKTERWEEINKEIAERLIKIYGDSQCRMCGADWGKFSYFITQLLSDARREHYKKGYNDGCISGEIHGKLVARREERERCLEALPIKREMTGANAQDVENWGFNLALTTAEERIKSLSLPDQEQLSSKENQDE